MQGRLRNYCKTTADRDHEVTEDPEWQDVGAKAAGGMAEVADGK